MQPQQRHPEQGVVEGAAEHLLAAGGGDDGALARAHDEGHHQGDGAGGEEQGLQGDVAPEVPASAPCPAVATTATTSWQLRARRDPEARGAPQDGDDDEEGPGADGLVAEDGGGDPEGQRQDEHPLGERGPGAAPVGPAGAEGPSTSRGATSRMPSSWPRA